MDVIASADRRRVESSFDALFAACVAVGRSLAIDMRRPPDLDGRRAPLVDCLDAIGAASGVHVRRSALDGRWWTRDCGPVLAFDRADRVPVAIIPRAIGGYWLVRSGRRRARLTPASAAALADVAYVFCQRLPDTNISGLALLQRGLTLCRSDMKVIAIATLAVALLSAVVPISLGLLVDVVIPGHDRSLLLQIGALLLAASAAQIAFTIVHQTALRRLEGRVEAWLQMASWERLLRLRPAFFWDYTTGDISQRISALSRCQQGLTTAIFAGVKAGAVFLVCGALLLVYGGWIGFMAIVLSVCAGIGAWLFGRTQIRTERDALIKGGEVAGLSIQIIGGLLRLRSYGAEQRAIGVWSRKMAEKVRLSARAKTIGNQLAAFVAIFVPASVGAILAYHQGLFGGVAQPMSIGQFVAFLALFVQFIVAVLTGVLTAVIGASALLSYDRLRPILDADVESGSPGRARLQIDGSAAVKSLTFRYKPGYEPALWNVTFAVAPGECVGIVGPSGSGKSTLLRALLGLAVPESGGIYYGGVHLRDLDLRAFRRSVGVVLQTTELIPGTIANVVRGAMELSADEIWAALRVAAMDDVVAAMPLGLFTHVGHGGMALSEGQRQRLLIASAVARRPKILFLDEATSAVDDGTQETIRRNLAALDVTRILVAHRLGVVRHCDRLMVLERGRIVETGNYADLCARDGLFKRLASEQTAQMT